METQPFGSCCQPEIFDGKARRVHIGFGHGVPAKDFRPGSCRVARHADINRRLQDPFQLERQVLGTARFIEELGRRQSFAPVQLVDPRSCLRSTNEDEVPGLHEAH
jgi:hypothetical protein